MIKSDFYTKIILTVIALNLCYLSFQSGINVNTSANQKNIAKANLFPINNDKPKENYALVPLNEDGSINVKINNTDDIDVNIRNIDTYDKMRVSIEDINTSDELDVNIDETGGGWISSGGPIKVKID